MIKLHTRLRTHTHTHTYIHTFRRNSVINLRWTQEKWNGWRRRKKYLLRYHTFFGHKTVVHGLHVVLHLVRPRELLAAHRTGKDFSLAAFVIEEGVPLETILIFERFHDIGFRAFQTPVHAFIDARVPEQVETTYGHLGQLLGWIAARCRASSHTSSSRRCFGWRRARKAFAAGGRRVRAAGRITLRRQ